MATRKISILETVLFLRRHNNMQTMTMIISGTDYVLYSMLKVSNVSLNIILHDLYSRTESNNR